MDIMVPSNHVVTTSDLPGRDDPPRSSAGLRLHSLADLGAVLAQLETATCVEEPDRLSLEDALALLTSSEEDLATATASDADARHAAEDLLARYDQARDHARHADAALTRANALVTQATELADRAFTPTARESARAALALARRVVEAAAREREQSQSEEASIGNDPRVERLLRERQARDEATRAEAERVARLAEMRRAVEEAQFLADRQRVDEACALLAPLVSAFPEEGPLRALYDRLSWQARVMRSQCAQATLWDIRRRLRKRPAEALVAVEQTDFAGLDEDLARQLFGEWLRAARALDLPGALRCTPEPHRGALLVPRGPDGTLAVVSAVGGSPLAKGQIVHPRDLRGLRPLASPRR
jgi:hypothetical protein